MIPLTCPNCGYSGDIPGFLDAGESYELAIQAALRISPTLAPLVWRYLYLFRPAKNRIQADRLARIIGALAEQIEKAEVTRAGITWTAPLALWEMALRIIVDAPPPELPLKNHHYLFQIVANLAARAAAKTERQAEEAARQPERRFYQAGQPIPQPEAPAPPASTPKTFRPPADWLKNTLQKIIDGEGNASDAT